MQVHPGRGLVASKDFKCGDVVFQEKGFRAKSAEHLVLEVLSSPEARAQVAHLYQGPVHHLQGHCVKIPEGITEEEWEEVYSKVRFNSFHLNGCCFLPVMALFNHSCAPNAAITQLPPHSECHTAMVVVAELGISKGTEIVYSYNSDCLTVPLQVRRQRLLSNWGFLCKCSRCEAEDSRPEADSEVQQNLFFCDTDELEDLLSQENGKLHDLQLYHSRQEALHLPGLSFPDRKRLFSAQLAAAVRLFPYLHPTLGAIYEELHDLCEASDHRAHCEKVFQFYRQLGEKGSATWPALEGENEICKRENCWPC